MYILGKGFLSSEFIYLFQSKEMNCTIVGPDISRHC